MKSEKKLQKIAEKILSLEANTRKGRDTDESQAEIERITNELSVEEMMMIDDYIAEKMYH